MKINWRRHITCGWAFRFIYYSRFSRKYIIHYNLVLGWVGGGFVLGSGICGGFVFRGLVGRVGRFVLGVLGVTVVLDISNVSRVAIDLVCHGLSAAVRKENAVGSRDNLAVAVLVVGIVVVRGLILDGPGEAVWLSRLWFEILAVNLRILNIVNI